MQLSKYITNKIRQLYSSKYSTSLSFQRISIGCFASNADILGCGSEFGLLAERQNGFICFSKFIESTF